MHPIIVLVGVSGAGKSGLEFALVSALPGCQKGVSTTTRAPRPGEVAGVHYHFVSTATFRRMHVHAEFAETIQAAGNLYGLTRVEIDHKLSQGPLLAVLEPEGIRQVKRCYPGRVVTLFLQAPGVEELQRRRSDRDGIWVADPQRAELDARIAAFEPEADAVIPVGTRAQTLAAALDLLKWQRSVA